MENAISETCEVVIGCPERLTITINPWTDSIEEGEFDLTIPTITGDSNNTDFEG